MYKISQFSKISDLTVKALRYYDKEGILSPSFRDEENQYRYYNDADFEKARLIKYLRSLDFSIMEIREILETAETENDLAFILREKIKIIEKNISKEKELIRKISKGLPAYETKQPALSYKIDVTDVKEMLAATIRFTGRYSDLGKYVPLLYQAVKGCKTGRHFNCYYDDACVEQADIELCLPVKCRITHPSVTCKKLPGIKALRTLHYGSYDTLYLAYKSVFAYANANNYKILVPTREVYLKSPGMIFKGNPANYTTEILLPFEIL